MAEKFSRKEGMPPTLMHLSMLSRRGGGSRAWGGDLTFFQKFAVNFPAHGQSFQSVATKFPHPGLHIAVHPKAGPKKSTIRVSPNRTLQSLFINVAASPKIHVLITAAIKTF